MFDRALSPFWVPKCLQVVVCAMTIDQDEVLNYEGRTLQFH